MDRTSSIQADGASSKRADQRIRRLALENPELITAGGRRPGVRRNRQGRKATRIANSPELETPAAGIAVTRDRQSQSRT